jgi:prevent-host-death family protein
MVSVKSTDIQKTFGKWLEKSHDEPVAITRYDRPTAYLVSAEMFEQMFASYRRAIPIEMLTEREIDLIMAARVETDEPYNLADLPETGPDDVV